MTFLLNQSKGAAAQIHFKIIKRFKTNKRFLHKCIYYYTDTTQVYIIMKIDLSFDKQTPGLIKVAMQ